MAYQKLTSEEEHIITHKGTEMPFSGQYNAMDKEGIYQCKRCLSPLYSSSHKFDSHCGWPSFDDEIKDAIKKIPDKDGRRIEIVCANCGGILDIFLKESILLQKTQGIVSTHYHFILWKYKNKL